MTFQPRHLYVHVPFCDGKCDYCAFFSVPYSRRQAETYLAALTAEIGQACEDGPGPLTVDTVYVGGGTPSVLDPDLCGQLLGVIRQHVRVMPRAEWTCEANPGTITAEWLAAIRAHGVNRISLGVQALDDDVLRSIGRRHGVRESLQAVEKVRTAGIGNLGIDLIAGLPGVDNVRWREWLQRAVDLKPEHVSVYALSVEPGSRWQGRVEAGRVDIPGEDAQLEALATTEEVLCRNGFEHYEISNYAQPGFSCRHNLACWRGRDYLGLGPAAAARRGPYRHTNRADLAAYTAALQRGDAPPRERTFLTAEDDLAERFVFRLRLAEGLSIDDVRAAAGPAATWTAVLARLREDGLAAEAGGRWRLTARGRDLCDYVVREMLMPCT